MKRVPAKDLAAGDGAAAAGTLDAGTTMPNTFSCTQSHENDKPNAQLTIAKH